MSRRSLSVSLLALAAALLQPLHAQQTDHHEADRVTAAVNPQSRRTLAGHLPAWATAAHDEGAVSTDVALSDLTVVLARSAATQAAFEQLLADQQNPASPRYHQWLTPQQVGEQFGPTSHDIEAVKQWLSSQGLRVDSLSPSRIMITFSGASSSVAHAVGSEFHRYTVHTHRDGIDGTESRLSIDSEPQVPAALAPVIAGFKGLSEEQLEPQSRMQRVAAPQPNASTALDSPTPEYTYNGSHYIAPADFVTIFDIKPAYNAGINGTGVKVAIIGESRVYASDITTFQTNTGLNASAQPVTIIPTTGTDPGVAADVGEQTLDTNRVMSTAPGAEADLVVSGGSNGLTIAMQYEVNTLLDPIMTISYGGCESSQSDVSFYNSLFSTAAGEGITTFISSGDADAGCSTSFTSTTGLSINDLCSSSYVTCVGGTEFNDTASPSTYWSSSNVSSTLSSALSYIPEGAWNDPGNSTSGYHIEGTGGGVSKYITKPSWQTGTGVPNDGYRDTPDVALPAAGHDGYYSCLTSGSTPGCSGGGFIVFSGTSASAPGMAGIMALVVQKLGVKQGNFNPTFYRLAASTSLNVFHDATPASSGVTNCSVLTASMCNNSEPSSTALTGGLTGYALQTGYDLATGWGSVDVGNLITAVVTPYVTPTVTISATSTSITTGSSDNFTVTLTGVSPNPTPTGSVQFYDSSTVPTGSALGTALGSPVTLSSGTGSLNGQVFTTSGTHYITAKYLADTVYVATVSNTITLTVSGTTSSPYYTLTPASSTLTIAAPGATTGNTDAITAASVNSFTGTVPLTCLVTYNGTGTVNDKPACSVLPTSVTLTANGTATATVTITTTAAHAVKGTATARLGYGLAGGALACLLLCLPLRRTGAHKRHFGLFAAALLLLLASAGLSGCGGGGTPATASFSDTGTTLGSYTVQVIGTVSGTSTTGSFSLTVN